MKNFVFSSPFLMTYPHSICLFTICFRYYAPSKPIYVTDRNKSNWMIDDILALQTIRCQYEHGRKKLLVGVNLRYCNVGRKKQTTLPK